jgi:hypothetical protein
MRSLDIRSAAGQKCLLGIISLKIYQTPSGGAPENEQKDIAKYFVPASITTWFRPITQLCAMGADLAVHGLCRALAARGHELHVFTTNVDGPGITAPPVWGYGLLNPA